MKRFCVVWFGLIAAATLYGQGAGVDSLRLRSNAGGAAWLLLPQTATAQYRLLLPPSLGTNTNQLLWVNGATGQLSLLPPGTIGQILQLGTGGLSWVDLPPLIAQNAWSLSGNSITGTEFLGTTNNQPLVIATTNTTTPQPIQFRTNNTERMRITATGDVGIGTSSPTERLQVHDGNVAITNSGTAGQLRLHTPGGSNYTAFVAQAQTGNITYTLPADLTAGTLVTNGRILQSDPGGTLSWLDPTALAATTAWALGGNTLTSVQNLGTQSNHDLPIITNSVERMRVTVGGNVGIGTANPNERLDVAGNVQFSGALMPGGNPGTSGQVLVSQGAGTAPAWQPVSSLVNAWFLNGNSITSAWDGSNGNFLGTTNNQPLVIATTNTTTPQPIQFWTNNTERVRVTATGNVGIGTATPAERLDVAGNVQFSGALMPAGNAGTSGDVLVSQGAGTAPAWQPVSSLVNAWSLNGNSITPGDFLGTTNAQPLVIRVSNQQTFQYNTNLSLQRDGGGNARGQFAVDLQITRGSNTQVASGQSSVIAGGSSNTASGSYAIVGGGYQNSAAGWSSFVGGGQQNSATADYATISGGQQNSISGQWATIGGGQNNNASGANATIGGGGLNSASGNYSTIAGGYGNQVSNFQATVSGGFQNTASGDKSTVGGGLNNTASGERSTVSGGSNNTAAGYASAIPGGNNLRVGARSFGFSGQTSSTQTDLSANSHIAAFVDVDLWLYSRDRTQASQLRFYEAQAHGSGANYVALRAPTSLSANTTYTLPADLTTTNTVATGVLQTDASGNLSWLTPSVLVTGSAWALTGNSGTNPAVNFLGTTDAQPLVIRVNNTPTFRFNTNLSLQRDAGGNPRGQGAVDLQTVRGAATQVASGDYSAIGGGWGNTASGYIATVGGGNLNTASGNYATVSGGWSNIASGNTATVGGGISNTASSLYATVGGGIGNTASGGYATVGGGFSNIASGEFSAIPGGNRLQVGARSFGFSGQTSGTITDLSANSNIAAFVDVDLWLYSRDFTNASQLRFYEAQAHGSGANYVALRAPTSLSANTTYTLPADLTAGTLVSGGRILQSDASGNLSWLNPSSLGSSNAWLLSGNSGTNPTTNFIGTTDAQPLVVRVNNQQTFQYNTNLSVQRDAGGNARGQGAVDLQVSRSAASQVASGLYSVIGGGANNSAGGNYTVINGGIGNTINSANFRSVIGGGESNTINGNYGVIAGGISNTINSDRSTIGGGEGNTTTQDYATIAGGRQNTAANYATVGGGQSNQASGQYSTVGGGRNNTASGDYTLVAGGQNNQVTTQYSAILGGRANQVTAGYSSLGGGQNNWVSGQYSSIPGGFNLRIGNRSFGFSGQTDVTQTDLSSNSNIAAFVDVDLWLYNVRNQASQLRLYEPSGAGTNFTAFRAQAQASDIIYTLPASDGSPGQVLTTDGSGQLSWSWNSGGTIFVRKTANESVTNSTTPQADDHLYATLPANSIWEVEILLRTQSAGGDGGNGGIQVQLNAPTGTSMQVYVEIKKGGGGGDLSHHWQYGWITASNTPVGYDPIPGTTQTGAVKLKGLVIVGSTGGTLQLYWAQNTANGNATTVYANSYMKLTRIQ